MGYDKEFIRMECLRCACATWQKHENYSGEPSEGILDLAKTFEAYVNGSAEVANLTVV